MQCLLYKTMSFKSIDLFTKSNSLVIRFGTRHVCHPLVCHIIHVKQCDDDVDGVDQPAVLAAYPS
jgi:hypothetical protein